MKPLLPLFISALILTPTAAIQAQTNDLNFIVSPTTSYSFWHKDINFGNTAHWGARAGWSFGQHFEIYGNFDRSFDLKAKLRSGEWNVLQNLADKMDNSNVDLTRFGGELKFNFLPNKIGTPYLLAGAGVMKIKYDSKVEDIPVYKEEQLYGVVGAGLKINLYDRLSLGLEVRNTLFNLDEGSYFRNSTHTGDNTLSNWSIGATLNAYLGGTRRAEDPLEAAYRARYSGGLEPPIWVIEPGLAYINFHDNSLLHDQWMGGIEVGADFSPILGARAFYYASSEDHSKLSFRFNDDLQLVGANLLGRLNYLRGLTPYLTLGGGYMFINDQYIDRDGGKEAKDGWFAMAGAGLEMPLHKNISIFGNANAMFVAQENPNLDQTYRPSQVKTNMMYRFGVRFRWGKSSKTKGQYQVWQNQNETLILQNQQLQEQVKQQSQKTDSETTRVMSFYDERIARLDTQLSNPTLQKDTVLKSRLQQERKLLSEAKTQLVSDTDQKVDSTSVREIVTEKNGRRTIVLTAAQLNELVRRVVNESKAASPDSEAVTLSDLDKILLFALVNNGHTLQGPAKNETTLTNEQIRALLKRIEQLEKRTYNTRTTNGK